MICIIELIIILGMDDATDKDENSYKSASWDTVAKVLKRSLTAPTAKKLKMQEITTVAALAIVRTNTDGFLK